MEFLATVNNVSTSSELNLGSLEVLENAFRRIVGNKEEISKEDFQRVLVTKNRFFNERVFQIFDRDSSGSISLDEFIDAMREFATDSAEDKLRFLFRIYDLDGNGTIQFKELRHVLQACMNENGFKFNDEQLDDLTTAMFEDADKEHMGAITFEALKTQLNKYAGLMENLTISIQRWLVPAQPEKKTTSRLDDIIAFNFDYNYLRNYLKNHKVLIGFLIWFFLVNIFLFLFRAYQYRNSNWFTIIARACGFCLNFDCSILLVFMLRQSLTFLRTKGFSTVLPLDDHIRLHKLTGALVFVLGVVHSLAHIFNFTFILVNDPSFNKNNNTVIEWLFTSKPGLFGLIEGWANPTGMFIFAFVIVIYICSQSFIRRGGLFEVFYWTHLLYVPFWILLILHGPTYWIWFIVPGAIYLVERLKGLYWTQFCSDGGRTYVTKGLTLPSTVTHLIIKRPARFFYNPGDYVFLNIPIISKYEWHPFTISSAPEQEDHLWLHIRGVGEWTNALYRHFENIQNGTGNTRQNAVDDPVKKKITNGFETINITDTKLDKTNQKTAGGDEETKLLSQELLVQMNDSRENSDEKVLEVILDGPYGAPSSHIFAAEHAVLIGTGIGVTPFASILQSIMHKYWAARHICPNCDFCWAGELPASIMNLKKVDFFWINRDQRSFEWFVNLLSELEIEQAKLGETLEKFLEMHMYITSALKNTDMRAIGLQLALDLLHKKEKRDLISGLRTRTNAGRPDWDKIFTQIAEQKKGHVTVFYCGPPRLLEVLAVKCDEFGFSLSNEVF